MRLPGDKSISHRAAMFSALAEGETEIVNFASSADCAATVNCLKNLGVEIRRDGSNVKVKGAGKNGFTAPQNPLDCENSGTTMRLLAGILAGQSFISVLTGDESLSKRPMRRVIEPLEKMGAKIESVNDCAPLTIRGRNPLQSGFISSTVSSAQVKSCVLLAGLFADGKTIFPEKVKTRDHTERMIEWFGVELFRNKTESGEEIGIDGNQKLKANGTLNVPSDISSAAFFLVAAACLKGSELRLENVGLNPSRTAVLDVLQSFGAQIEIENKREVCNEPVGDLVVRGGGNLAPSEPQANILRGEIIANLIDELPILSVFGTQIEGGLEIRDAQELRVKESDRIAAVVENLKRMGATVEEFPDGLRVEKSNLKGATIESFGDHRIAMAFSVAALFAEGESEINGADCVKVSMPEFFDSLKTVCE